MSDGRRVDTRVLDQVFPDYAAEQRALGFDEVAERRWMPLSVVPAHVHEFAAEALVIEGEMWLTVGDETHHLTPGSTFELDANVSDAERYVSEGAMYWVARRKRSVSTQIRSE